MRKYELNKPKSVIWWAITSLFLIIVIELRQNWDLQRKINVLQKNVCELTTEVETIIIDTNSSNFEPGEYVHHYPPDESGCS